jgi:hypothetical protein
LSVCASNAWPGLTAAKPGSELGAPMLNGLRAKGD